MPSKREAMTARAISLVGCGYIYGATGWICTPSRLAQQEKQYPSFAKQMKRYGKKWMGKPCYDCAQLTRDVARQAGISLPSGATSQWRAAGIWKEKDVIDTLPDEAGIFLFTMRDGRMTHTGVSIGNGKRWTHAVTHTAWFAEEYPGHPIRIGRGWQLTTTRRLKRRILHPNQQSRPFAQEAEGKMSAFCKRICVSSAF